ncbi:MAG: 3-methyl-2-oxobutanoate hydroxymethyltransferase [Nitrospirae bacterium]|nr:3-methyl-2-oxobutanoate hydroxymethyltransferase [Nitrospirota bacterium]
MDHARSRRRGADDDRHAPFEYDPGGEEHTLVATERTTIHTLIQKKKDGEKIAVVTAYDYSLGIVVQGEETTLPVTMDQMVYHTRLVSRAVKKALVVGDMPFLSYQAGVEDAVRNAGRFVQEGFAQAVKLEGGAGVLDQVSAISRAGIPVMGHLGLTPQSVHQMGGYKVQARSPAEGDKLLADARALEEAGVFAIVLEGIPARLAKRTAQSVSVPTIGIGAGPHCDGQVLVLHDLLGLFVKFSPKFVKRYANLREESLKALRQYRREVLSGEFPTDQHSF